jgi:hypothetical protein
MNRVTAPFEYLRLLCWMSFMFEAARSDAESDADAESRRPEKTANRGVCPEPRAISVPELALIAS